ncbi:MAG: sensor histidine kinase, partial [Roseburia sp.]|nr:sensor histidine kinase [Roseburia sp.]
FSSMVTVCILFYINLIIFEICSKLSENFILENERTVCTQQINIIAKSTEEQKKMMEEFYAEKHNLVNELAALMDSIEHSSREHVLERLRGIVKAYNMGERVSDCGNSTIDTLINFKYAAAKEMGISFQLKIFVPECLPVNECDLGVVIGNALDNAIEATRDCLEHEKVIRIVMGVKKEAFVVIIKNPYEHRLKKDKTGELASTKEESKGHGYGVRAIKHVVEKYHGEVLIEETPEQFILRAFMNIGEL